MSLQYGDTLFADPELRQRIVSRMTIPTLLRTQTTLKKNSSIFDMDQLGSNPLRLNTVDRMERQASPGIKDTLGKEQPTQSTPGASMKELAGGYKTLDPKSEEDLLFTPYGNLAGRSKTLGTNN